MQLNVIIISENKIKSKQTEKKKTTNKPIKQIKKKKAKTKPNQNKSEW